jgi:hypothetical protein
MKMKEELSAAATKAAPPVAVAGPAYLFDLTLNDWVGIATLAYLALQAFFLIRSEMKKRGKK